MQSKLNITEFRERLRNSTEFGSLKVNLSPFRLFPSFGGKKPFYGFFDDESFHLTINSVKSPTYFIIIGKYKNVNNILKVDCIVEANSKIQLFWVKFSPVICLVAINLFFLFFGKGLRKGSTIVNLFLLVIIFYSRWKEDRKRRKLEQKFIEIFEIKLASKK
ncbi:hypothetical protein [Flavobacterium sp.]|uniref:hypothetical protein n=1 Tax=Flavobacterium sp. TaxID=239 RepID=UPI00374CD26A